MKTTSDSHFRSITPSDSLGRARIVIDDIDVRDFVEFGRLTPDDSGKVTTERMAKVIEWCCSDKTHDEACPMRHLASALDYCKCHDIELPVIPLSLRAKKTCPGSYDELSQYRDRQTQGLVCYSIRLEFMDSSEWDSIFAVDLTKMLTSGGIKSLEFLSTGGISRHLMQAVRTSPSLTSVIIRNEKETILLDDHLGLLASATQNPHVTTLTLRLRKDAAPYMLSYRFIQELNVEVDEDNFECVMSFLKQRCGCHVPAITFTSVICTDYEFKDNYPLDVDAPSVGKFWQAFVAYVLQSQVSKIDIRKLNLPTYRTTDPGDCGAGRPRNDNQGKRQQDNEGSVFLLGAAGAGTAAPRIPNISTQSKYCFHR